MGWLAVAGLLWGLSTAATAASVSVTVSDGAVLASPGGITLAATDDSLVFKLGTAGYTFPSSGAVVITGTGSSFRCTTASSKTSVTCKKTGQGNGSQQSYQINVLPPGSSTPLASPEVWVVSD
jgi:opacity protein-like surface antigen